MNQHKDKILTTINTIYFQILDSRITNPIKDVVQYVTLIYRDTMS